MRRNEAARHEHERQHIPIEDVRQAISQSGAGGLEAALQSVLCSPAMIPGSRQADLSVLPTVVTLEQHAQWAVRCLEARSL